MKKAILGLVLTLGLTLATSSGAALGDPHTSAGSPAAPQTTGPEQIHPADDQHVSAQLKETETTAVDVLPVVADELFRLGRDRGFASQVVHESERTIDLYWVGEVPDDIQAYIDRRPFEVAVRLHQDARLPRVDGLAAMDRILQSSMTKTARITSINLRSDGSGITVNVSGQEPDVDVQRRIAEVAGLPLELLQFVSEQGAPVPLVGRHNDAAPYSGGSRIYFGINGCSTGFAALAQGQGRLLSASHCDPSSTLSVFDGGWHLVAPGTSTFNAPSIDSMSIDPTPSPATQGRIYVGAWNSTSTAGVKSWASNWNGQTVCSGGATTGSTCGVITADAVGVPGLSGSFYVRATSATGGAYAGDGDSGGPIYVPVSGGVQARGTLIAGYTETERVCGPRNPDVIAACYRDIVYLPISVALNTWGHALELG